MLYKFAVTTPINTTAIAPQETKVNLASGIVSQVMIEFPAGCVGLVGCRISRGLFQLWPLTGGEWFVTDDFTIDFKEHYVLDEGPCILRIETYNTDTQFEHTLKIAFAIIEEKPDPAKQMKEIAERVAVALENPPPPLPSTVDQTLDDIRNLLYAIYTNSIPALYNAIITKGG